jgi:hypothetical protein
MVSQAKACGMPHFKVEIVVSTLGEEDWKPGNKRLKIRAPPAKLSLRRPRPLKSDVK